IFPGSALEYTGGGEIPCSGISCAHASGRARARVERARRLRPQGRGRHPRLDCRAQRLRPSERLLNHGSASEGPNARAAPPGYAASCSSRELSASSTHATSTGSGRIVSVTALPAGSAVASEVGSCASTVVSPRSTVILLLAPRNVTAITVPVIAPDCVTVTASGRTSTVAGPPGVAGSASG